MRTDGLLCGEAQSHEALCAPDDVISRSRRLRSVNNGNGNFPRRPCSHLTLRGHLSPVPLPAPGTIKVESSCHLGGSLLRGSCTAGRADYARRHVELVMITCQGAERAHIPSVPAVRPAPCRPTASRPGPEAKRVTKPLLCRVPGGRLAKGPMT